MIKRGFSVFAVCLGLFFSLAANATTPPICEIHLSPDQHEEVFGHTDLGVAIVEYCQVLDRAVAKVEHDSTLHAAAFENPEFMSKFNLINYYRTAIFPLLQKYISNAALLNEAELDRSLRELGLDEKDMLLSEMEHHNSNLIPTLLTMSGLSGESVIVELAKEENARGNSEVNGKIYNMYHSLARHMGWKFEELQASLGDPGVKNATFRLSGSGVYQYMMFESGSHRYIRPGSGRSARVTHTDSLRITVYKEPAPMTFSFDSVRDVEFTAMRSQGAGGQHVNKTESAVRAIHKPTGITVRVESERSQHANKDIAIAILRAKVYEKYLQDHEDRRTVNRDEAEGFSADDRWVRTYDERYNRVELQSILDGNLKDYIRIRQREYLAQRLPTLTQRLIP